jgi:tetratricopeptide (TPR) repeat protein
MRWTALLLVVLVDASPSLAQAQSPDPKQIFTAALGGLTAALEGRFGDDASRVHEHLTTLEKSLAAWDDALRGVEASIALDLAKATPQAATRLHMALAVSLAERGRIDEALKRLATAIALSPRDVDAHTVLGLVHSQLTPDIAAATKAFREAVDADPTAPLQRYLLAKALADAGAIDEAAAVGLRLRNDTRDPNGPDRSPFVRISIIPEIPGSEPYFPPGRYADAFALMGQGRYEAAAAAINAASRTDPLLSPPPAATVDLQQAGAALRDGDVSAALTAIDRVRQSAPTWGEVHRLRGVALVAGERPDDAVAAFREALRLSPSDERAHVALADLLLREGRYEEADETLLRAIAALPSSPRLHYVRSRVFQRRGLYPEALAELDRAMTLRPSLPLLGMNSLYDTIATMRRGRQEFADATVAFSRRVALVPNEVAAHRDLGDLYFRQGLDDLAWNEFAIAEALAPRDVATQASLAQLHLRAGRHQEAADSARRIIQLAPDHVQAHFVLGTALMRLDQRDEGARVLDIFARLEAAEAAARQLQLELAGLRREAEVAAGQGDHARAVALLTQIVEKEPKSPGAHVALGVALIRAGRGADAVDRLQAAAGLGAFGDVYRHLADAYALIGQTDMSARAREVYIGIRRERLREEAR